MPEVQVGAIAKSVRGLTLDVIQRTDRAKRQRELEGLRETEEQIKIDVRGRAEEFPEWSEVHVNFETLFIDASGQRDTEFDRPHFTYGAYIERGGPVGLLACITRWDVTPRDEVTGCILAVGAVSTDQARRFRGELHARFQGYGAPRDAYGGLTEQLDLG